MLKNQKRKQKMCRCGRNTVYTGTGTSNPKIDGVDVCEECMLEYLINRYHNREGSQ